MTYDPNNELALQVRGCDVNVKRGSAFEVTIKRWLGSKSSHAVTFNTAGTHAVNIVADNQGACDALFFECHQICSVTITTNVNSADVPKLIYVVQRSDDTADHISVTVQPGVHLGSFRTDGPTARVTVQDAQFDGTLTVRGVGAPVFVQNSVFVGADLRATKGSVYLIDTKPMSRSLALSYRTTSSNMCLAARSNSVSVVEAPTWNPNPAPWSRCSLDLTWWGLQAGMLAVAVAVAIAVVGVLLTDVCAIRASQPLRRQQGLLHYINRIHGRHRETSQMLWLGVPVSITVRRHATTHVSHLHGQRTEHGLWPLWHCHGRRVPEQAESAQ